MFTWRKGIITEREALFKQLRSTFCEDWKEAEESLKAEREAKFGDLYFVSAGDAVKIGRTTNFTTRLRFIQAHNHEQVECLALLKGQGWRERDLHKRFRARRLRGERFERCPENDLRDWASPEEREKALANNSVWSIQWYPNTPVGFCQLYASSLEALLTAIAMETQRAETENTGSVAKP